MVYEGLVVHCHTRTYARTALRVAVEQRVPQVGSSHQKCLSIQHSVEATGGGNIGAVPCAEATRWVYSSRTRQLMVENTTGGGHNGQCLDVDHGVGPTVRAHSCLTSSAR